MTTITTIQWTWGQEKERLVWIRQNSQILSFPHVEEPSPSDPIPAPPPNDKKNEMCPYCHQTPCVTVRPPTWLIRSAPPSLGNVAKRYPLYRKFWSLMRSLGLWNDPHYLALKAAYTTTTNKREILLLCIINVSNMTCEWCCNIMTKIKQCLIFYRKYEEDSQTKLVYPILTINQYS